MKNVVKYFTVCIALLFVSTSTYAGDHLHSFGPSKFEHMRNTSFFITPNAIDSQSFPAVATDGDTYLIIWTVNKNIDGTELWGARISSDGKTLDPSGFLIHRGPSHRFPRVAYGNGKFLIVWQTHKPYERHSVNGIIIDINKNFLVHHAYIAYDSYSTYPTTTTYTGNDAINSQGIFIFPDIQDHYNQYQEVDPLTSFSAPGVSFNGKDFVVSSGGIVRLVEPISGKVKRHSHPVNVVYPLGKPISKSVTECKYSSNVECGTNRECLLTCVKGVDQGNTNLHAVKLRFSGTDINIGADKSISNFAQAPYGHFATATDGTGGYMLAWHDNNYSSMKKKKPSDAGTSDLFAANISTVKGKDSDFIIDKAYSLYMKKRNTDYYPQIAFDGLKYVVIWGTGGTNFKTQWNADNFNITWIEPDNWKQTEFWDFIDTTAFNEAMKPLTCMNDYRLFGQYISPDGYVADSFGLLSNDDGIVRIGMAGRGNVVFGKKEGLLVYNWINLDRWTHTYPGSLIRAYFLKKSHHILKKPDTTVPGPIGDIEIKPTP